MPPVDTWIPDSERIRAFRLRLGLDQAALSERMGRDRTTVTKLETGGIKRASHLLMWQLANALGVHPEEITRSEAGEPNGGRAA